MQIRNAEDIQTAAEFGPQILPRVLERFNSGELFFGASGQSHPNNGTVPIRRNDDFTNPLRINARVVHLVTDNFFEFRADRFSEASGASGIHGVSR